MLLRNSGRGIRHWGARCSISFASQRVDVACCLSGLLLDAAGVMGWHAWGGGAYGCNDFPARALLLRLRARRQFGGLICVGIFWHLVSCSRKKVEGGWCYWWCCWWCFLLNCVIEFEKIDPNRCQREERVRHPESKGRQGWCMSGFYYDVFDLNVSMLILMKILIINVWCLFAHLFSFDTCALGSAIEDEWWSRWYCRSIYDEVYNDVWWSCMFCCCYCW